MKKKGNKIEFTDDRNAELVAAFRKAMNGRTTVNLQSLGAKIVKMPCSRFWVSEERATDVIALMRRGMGVTENMLPERRRMYEEIHRRVEKLAAERPEASLTSMVNEVVYTPAPEFYLSPATAVKEYYAHHRRRRLPPAIATVRK